MGNYIPYVPPPDPLETYSRVVQLRGLMQQQQLQRQLGQMQVQQQQQQLQDNQIFRDAWASADNWDDALNYMRKNGGSLNLVGNAEKMRIDARLKSLEGDERQQQLDARHADWVTGQVDHLMQLPPDQRAAMMPAIQAQHAQLFPHYAAQFPQQVQTDNQSLQTFRNIFTAHNQEVADARRMRRRRRIWLRLTNSRRKLRRST